MYIKIILLSILIVSLFDKINMECKKEYNADCGPDCTGTPPCWKIHCGNVPDMCYCYCSTMVCKTTDLGYTWNDGIKLANGSFALNGTKGDGKEYKCD
jgi:hypothetical protein